MAAIDKEKGKEFMRGQQEEMTLSSSVRNLYNYFTGKKDEEAEKKKKKKSQAARAVEAYGKRDEMDDEE